MQIYWVVIERDGYGKEIKDLAFGPYHSEETAEHAMIHSRLIDGECHINCLDCYVVETHSEASPENAEIVLIDLNDSNHTG